MPAATTPTVDPAPDVDGALEKLAAKANRIADERNAYKAAAKHLLWALARLADIAENVAWNEGNLLMDDRIDEARAAIAAAKAAGITGE